MPLRKAQYAKVSDLGPGVQGLNIVVSVVSVEPVIEKEIRTNQQTKKTSRMMEAKVADETGCVTFTARNEQIELLKPGATVVVRNSNVDVFKGFLRLNVTQWGKLSAYPDGLESTPQPPTNLNTEVDLSSVEYELVNEDN